MTDTRTRTEAVTDLTRRHNLGTLRQLLARLDRDAATNRNMTCDQKRNRWGYQLSDEAGAIRALMRENDALRLNLDPMTEGPRQILAEMAGE